MIAVVVAAEDPVLPLAFARDEEAIVLPVLVLLLLLISASPDVVVAPAMRKASNINDMDSFGSVLSFAPVLWVSSLDAATSRR